jgi:hypothetical protein
LAADILDGVVRLNPSQKQLASIFGVSVTYVAIARKLTPGKRAAILRGWDYSTSFAELMTPRPVALPAPDPKVIFNTEISDTELENLVRVAGTERVLAAAVAVEHNT